MNRCQEPTTRYHLQSRTELLDTQPDPRPDRVCVACVASLPALGTCPVGVCLTRAFARLECLPASGDDRSCLLGCRLVRCEATELFSTMFTLGYSFRCACGARVRGVPACLGCRLALLARVPVCVRMFTQTRGTMVTVLRPFLGDAFLVLPFRSFWIVLKPHWRSLAWLFLQCIPVGPMRAKRADLCGVWLPRHPARARSLFGRTTSVVFVPLHAAACSSLRPMRCVVHLTELRHRSPCLDPRALRVLS